MSKQYKSCTYIENKKIEQFKHRYLSLIQCEEQINIYPSIEGFNKIVENHLYHIHFNGFVFLSMNVNYIELNPYHFLDNKLCYKQGGICFELNSSLNELLRNLGYKTYLIEAMVDNFKDKSIPSYEIPTHSAIIVEFKSEYYLVDVGMGNYFRKPIPFFKEYQDFTGQYKIVSIDMSNKHFQLKRFSTKKNQWLSQYRFSIINKISTDFRPNVEKVCDESCHFSKEFFMMKPYSSHSSKIIDGGQGRELLWIHNTPKGRDKVKLDANLARQILIEEFNMNTEQIDVVLSKCY